MSDHPSQASPDTPEGADANPEAAAVIKRARRSFLVSIAVLVFGLMAVAVALVYRLNREEPGAGPYAITEIALPADAELVSASAGDGQVTLTYHEGDATRIRVVDGRDGTVIADIAVIGE
ncbi:DUF6476 family protein [Cucumibacter marinus]|uniref:DUF6476 family protein n=1 Tax=Cucumibacter marinus TaxID=1121252 RepID=UPI000429B542|nr:DUF6476 family protein [Cucumibacter marinus]